MDLWGHQCGHKLKLSQVQESIVFDIPLHLAEKAGPEDDSSGPVYNFDRLEEMHCSSDGWWRCCYVNSLLPQVLGDGSWQKSVESKTGARVIAASPYLTYNL